jgi:hypothetical protein
MQMARMAKDAEIAEDEDRLWPVLDAAMLYENYDQIITALPGPRRNWKILADAATEAGTKDAEGKDPNAGSIRVAFARVEKN